MPSFSLVHQLTGVPLSGYLVTEAREEDISEANERLAAAGSQHRYQPALQQRITTLGSQAAHDAPHPC